MSHIQSVRTAEPPRNRHSPLLHPLWLPAFPFSSPGSSDEPIVLFSTFTPPCFPNDGLHLIITASFSVLRIISHFEDSVTMCNEMSCCLRQNSSPHNTWGSGWLLLKRGARQRQTHHKIVQIMQKISLQFSPSSIATAQFRTSLIPKFLDTLES